MKQASKYFLVLTFLSLILYTQPELFAQAKRYTVFKAGFGLPYGAFGLNLEYRYKKMGGYIGAGYMKTQYFSTINIPYSFNGALGLKYYFFKTEDLWHPVMGIHAGWLNNYYHKDIGQLKYRSSVYGAALITGVEMIENMMSIELSMIIDPGFAILNPETHPKYSGKVYLTPSIGVGINIYAIRMYYRKKERLKKREENNIDEIKNNHLQSEKKDTLPVTIVMKPDISERIIRECNDTLAFPAIRSYKEDDYGNHWIGKQIADNLFLFLKINGKVEGYDKSLQTFQVDSNLKSHEVFVIKSDYPEQLEFIVNQAIENKLINTDRFNCYQGKLAIYTYGNLQKEISIQLNDLKLINEKQSELYFDEILICLVSEK